jgi:hypothetical protein
MRARRLSHRAAGGAPAQPSRPGIARLDLPLFRQFRISNRGHLAFPSEFFNCALARISHNQEEGRGFSPAVSRSSRYSPNLAPRAVPRLRDASRAWREEMGGEKAAPEAGLKPRPSRSPLRKYHAGEKSGLGVATLNVVGGTRVLGGEQQTDDCGWCELRSGGSAGPADCG